MRVLLAALSSPPLVRQRGLSLCAPSALRGTVGGATMAIPGGAGTTLRTAHCCTHALGSPASLIGSELPRYWAPALRCLPRPDALSPLPAARHRAGSCVRVHQHIMPDDMSITSPAVLGRLGRGYGPPSRRIQRPAADMFSLSLQVVGKNVSSSERASEKGGDSRRYERCYGDRNQRYLGY
jgi:hypothetical protein